MYAHLEETKDIISDNTDEVDVWMFSGQAPFSIAKNSLKSQSGFYPPLNGSSLTKVLLDISYKDNKTLQHLSFDTISQDELLETFSELGLQANDLKLFPNSEYKSTKHLIDYHYQLYKAGKVDSCITGVHEVYKQLKKINIPSYRIKATK